MPRAMVSPTTLDMQKSLNETENVPKNGTKKNADTKNKKIQNYEASLPTMLDQDQTGPFEEDVITLA
jgi:hypothetical protein